MDELRERLSLNYVSKKLPCREGECKRITDYVKSNLASNASGTMYISGMPGTGKTACVLQTVNTLKRKQKFMLITTNGIQLGDAGNLFIELHNKLFTANRKSKARSPSLAICLAKLKAHFHNKNVGKKPIVLIIDELDALVTKKQRLLYNIFDWTTLDHARLTIITMANTLDLPERALASRVSSRFGLNRICFQPYTHDQIVPILSSRLEDCKDVFEKDVILLIARKVASVSGDLRRALEALRLASDICLEEMDEKQESQKSSRRSNVVVHVPKLKMNHAIQATNRINSSAKIVSIKSASVVESMLLKSVLAEYKRTGMEDMTSDRIFDHFKSFYALELPATENGGGGATFDLFVRSLYNLDEMRLLIVEKGCEHWRRRLRLNVNAEDLEFAMKKSFS